MLSLSLNDSDQERFEHFKLLPGYGIRAPRGDFSGNSKRMESVTLSRILNALLFIHGYVVGSCISSTSLIAHP